jgi:hypothetical protein
MSAIISTGSITVESGKAAVLPRKHALYPKPQLPRWLGDARRLLKPVTLPDWEFPDAYQGKVFEEQGICIVIS